MQRGNFNATVRAAEQQSCRAVEREQLVEFCCSTALLLSCSYFRISSRRNRSR
jgi:hypothetical protein